MTADTVGGVWTYAVDLCRGLRRFNASIVLATMGAKVKADQRAQLAELDNVQLEESEFALEWMDEPWADVDRAGEWLLELEARHSPDLVHLNGYAHGALPWTVPALVVAHSCVLSWWQSVKGEPAPKEWNIYRERVGRGIRASDMVVAPSAWMIHQLGRYYGPLPLWSVVPNGRDGGSPAEEQKAPVVLSVGRLWDEAKNAALVAEAAAEISWPVELIGDATSPNGEVSNFTNVRLHGYVPPQQVRQAYQRASIYVSPAKYEPFGLAVLEAAMFGCALVLGDIASFREIWGDAAVYVPTDDSRALSGAIRRLIEDPAERRSRAAAARERARRYSAQAMTNAYHDTYLHLCGAHAQTAHAPLLS
jgi:glycogen synthase